MRFRTVLGVLLTVSLTVLIVTSSIQTNYMTNSQEECTSVIVTGKAAQDGRPILMKNRDTGDTMNKPVYHAPNGGHYGYVMINDEWMGINERGLAVMNTLVSALGFGGGGFSNGALNIWIVQNCESVEQVCFELNNTNGAIGPGKRQGGTCIGVIDRFGKGAFIEISGAGAYARFVVDGYDSEANHPRNYPGYASGPSGRDQYALDALNRIHTQKGVISWEDVAQNVSKYVRDKEQGTSNFSIDGEITNTATQAAMVAVSGDQEYTGKLNCMWGEYGNPPLIGLFVPSIAYAGQPPTILDNFWNEVAQKRTITQDPYGNYVPAKVRQVQDYTFFAEDCTFSRYDELVSTIPSGLTDQQLRTCLQTFVNSAVQEATQIYVAEPQISRYTTVHGTTRLQTTVLSNSTISNFYSSNSSFEISFDVTALENTRGFAYVTIPVELANGTFTVRIGSAEYTVEKPLLHEGNDIINFTYTNPNHIIIDATSSQQLDLNKDGKIDMKDIAIVAKAFSSAPGVPNWNPIADINKDGVIDMNDLAIISSHFM